jgi:protein phosphatase
MNRQFEYADVTDIGSREENQDFHDHVFTTDGALLVLADGMGGHHGGALASRCFVQSILKQATAQQHDLVKDPAQTLRRFFAAGAEELAHAVREEQLPEGPHTTCVMAWTTNNTLV